MSELTEAERARVNRDWEEFWLPIFTANGSLDMDMVKAELYDWHGAMSEVSRVYDEITLGRLSKPTTAADAIIAIVEERMNRIHHEAFEEGCRAGYDEGFANAEALRDG